MRPEGAGFIVRTVAEGVTREEAPSRHGVPHQAVELDPRQEREGAGAGAALHRPRPAAAHGARPVHAATSTSSSSTPRGEYERMLKFVNAFMPDFVGKIELYDGREPIFDAYGIEDEIDRALERKVWLQVRRLPDHRSGRGAHRHRRQHRQLRRQEEPRGDDHQDQPRGVQGDRLPAAPAQHRRHHHLRLHRHGQGAEPREGLARVRGGAQARQGQGQRHQDLASSAWSR